MIFAKYKKLIDKYFFLIQNNGANFIQAWHNANLGEGKLSLFKLGTRPFPRGNYNKKAKINWVNFKEILKGVNSITGVGNTEIKVLKIWIKSDNFNFQISATTCIHFISLHLTLNWLRNHSRDHILFICIQSKYIHIAHPLTI